MLNCALYGVWNGNYIITILKRVLKWILRCNKYIAAFFILQLLIKQPSIFITIIIKQLRKVILLHHLRQKHTERVLYTESELKNIIIPFSLLFVVFYHTCPIGKKSFVYFIL